MRRRSCSSSSRSGACRAPNPSEDKKLTSAITRSLTATDDDNHYRAFLIATTAGIYGLFPLLIKPAGTTLRIFCFIKPAHASLRVETPIKILFTLLWSAFVLPQLRKVVYRPLPNLFTMLIDKAETLYLYGFVFVQICEPVDVRPKPQLTAFA